MTIIGKNHIWRWLAVIPGGFFIIAFAAGFAWESMNWQGPQCAVILSDGA